jgi:hypothetical protein
LLGKDGGIAVSEHVLYNKYLLCDWTTFEISAFKQMCSVFCA